MGGSWLERELRQSDMLEWLKQINEPQMMHMLTGLSEAVRGQKYCLEEQRWQTDEWASLHHAPSGVVTIDGEEWFLEHLGGQPKLYICGGGHVSMPIVALAKKLGFYVTVLEDRPYFADRARAAGADTVVCDSFEKALHEIAGDADSYFV